MPVNKEKNMLRRLKKTAKLLLIAALTVSGCAVPETEQTAMSDTAINIMPYAQNEETQGETNKEEPVKVSLTQTDSPTVLSAVREKYSYVTNWAFTYAEDDEAIYMCDSKVNDANTGREHFVRRIAKGEETLISLPEIPLNSMVSRIYLSGHNLYFSVDIFDRTKEESLSTMFAYSDQGEFLFKKTLPEITGESMEIYSLFPDRQGGLWVVSPRDGMLCRISEKGAVTQEVTIPADYPGVFLSGQEENILCAVSVTENGFSAGRMNVKTKISETYLFEGVYGIQGVYSGRYSDLLVTNNTGLYKVTLGQEPKIEEALVYTDYGINFSEIQMIRETDGGYVIVQKNRASADVERIVLKTSAAAARKDLTVACIKCPDFLRFAVSRFNESSTDVRILIKSYYDKYAIDSSMEDILNKFNSDLMDKTAGDIICLDGIDEIGDRKVYLNKGLFVDLYELMDKDEQFDKNQYFTNVWRLNETDGRLFTMVPVFSLNTKYALKSDVGDVNHLDESVLFSADDPVSLYGPNYNQDMFLHELCVFSLGDITDEGAAIFDADQLERYFTFAAGLPTFSLYEKDGHISPEYSFAHVKSTSDYYYYKTRFARDFFDRPEMYLYDIRNATANLGHSFVLSDNEMAAGPEDIVTDVEVVAAGFPTKEGNGSAIVNRLELAVPVYTDQHEVVWDFLKYILSPEFQRLDERYKVGLPMNKSVYEEIANALMAYRGKEDDYYYMSGEEALDEVSGLYISYMIPPTTRWMVDEVAEAIEKADYLDKTDANVEAILKEELTEYVQGRLSAAEAAKSAVSRIRLYADERR